MTIRTILAPLDGGDRGRPAMELAFIVGRDFSAHVEVFHVRADPKAAVPLLGEGMSGAMIEEMIELAEKDAREKAETAKRLYDDFCRTYDVPQAAAAGAAQALSARWHEEVGREDEAVAHRARVHDLVVVGRPVAGEDQPSVMTLNAALFESGRPVLVAPPQVPSTAGRRVAVAWNGSAEAARAVAAAMSFLARAEAVYVVSAESDEVGDQGARDVVDHLAWHGISAEAVTFSPAGHSVGEAMLLECGKLDCDLLAMGAYTHSRVRQMILGGVTSHVLENAELPVLMTH
jgi:nucleotide-binding universal stress UspA family protein